MSLPNSRFLLALSMAALVTTACGPGQSAATATPAAAPTTGPAATRAGSSGSIKVTLQEFAVLPAQASAKAGDVPFEVTNKGPEDEHEFVVVKTNLAPDKLPTKATGEVDEEGAGIEVIDEVAEMAVGETHELKLNLAAGNYVLICNVFDQAENESHYQAGMRSAFTVN